MAVDAVDLHLQENKIYGLLGRNGAGKSTLLHLLTGQILKTSGTVQLFGEHPYENDKVLQRVCFIKESQSYIKAFTAKRILDLASGFYPNWDAAYADQLVNAFQLNTNKKVKALSRGMESTLGVIIGLASRAPLTIFDEPYLGLDAAARNLFYDFLLEDFSEQPRTIILSTHLIDEVSKLFEEILIMNHGQLTLQSETDKLREKAFYLSGTPEQLKPWIENKTIINKQELAGQQIVAVFGQTSPTEQQEIKKDGIAIEPIPMQKLMIYLTSEQGVNVQ